jgi:Zn-dependent protease with chaperone function
MRLRKIYRKLIDAAGLYYYVSLPFVAVILIAAAGGVFYAFLEIGRIPVRLLFVIALVTLGTIYKMVQSLFIKVKPEDPGRSLSPEEAPALWKLTEDVAADLGTRPVQEIRITPMTDVAVHERGSRKEKAQDKATRILILGTGVLNGFRTQAFRAVLAHEYGHFTHRDTAGGDVAFRVNNDIVNFAIAMARAGHAVWWNLGFVFVRIYHFLFRRITFGASRLQEVLADRMAALNYGADAFEEGLKHVIRRSVEFPFAANAEITLAKDARRPLNNLYELRVEGNAIDEAFQKALNRPTSEDDTHPGAADRFRLTRRVRSEATSSDSSMVWDLFQNREGLTTEFTQLIDKSIDRTAVAVPASAVPTFKEVDL